MKQVRLEELLERYYNAQTTHYEEQLLMELLSSDNLPSEYFSERDALLALMDMATLPEPDHLFESRMEAAIFTGKKSLLRSQSGDKRKFRTLYFALLSSAAGVLIVVSAWFMIGNGSEPADSFSSPELAYEETLRALHKMSAEMSRATSKLKPMESLGVAEKGMRNVGETGRLIDMGLSELEAVQITLTGKGLSNK